MDPKDTALVLIDMQTDFLEPTGRVGQHYKERQSQQGVEVHGGALVVFVGTSGRFDSNYPQGHRGPFALSVCSSRNGQGVIP